MPVPTWAFSSVTGNPEEDNAGKDARTYRNRSLGLPVLQKGLHETHSRSAETSSNQTGHCSAPGRDPRFIMKEVVTKLSGPSSLLRSVRRDTLSPHSDGRSQRGPKAFSSLSLLKSRVATGILICFESPKVNQETLYNPHSVRWFSFPGHRETVSSNVFNP